MATTFTSMAKGMVDMVVGGARAAQRGQRHDDDDVIEVIRRGIKKRRESVEMFEKGGRQELADKERAEVGMLERYLPAQVDPDEIRAAVKAAIASGANNVGTVMGKVMPQFKGRAEGSAINAIAREELGGK